jgi:tripartite-type tricarboxylate transporter receptor subunit TctC
MKHIHARSKYFWVAIERPAPNNRSKNKQLSVWRNTMTRFLQFAVASIAIVFASYSPTNAQTYPDRPIKLIVPFGAGTGADNIARIVGQHLSEELKQPVVIENKPGALGSIGAEFVARAKPDGYTVLLTANTSHSAAPTLIKNLRYDPIKDFVAVSRLGSLPSMLLVNDKSPMHSVKDMVAFAKANPGKLTYGTGNSTGIVTGGALRVRAGINFVSVPYKSTTEALLDCIAGRVMVVNTDFTIGIPQVKAGKLRAIAVTSEKRSALMPDLPSIAEAGYPGFDVASWQGVFVPAGTPKAIVHKLDSAIGKIMTNKQIMAHFAKLGFEVIYLPSDQFSVFVSKQLVHWTKMIKDAGLNVN